MKLLTATTRYYLLLTAGLFALASALLYVGFGWALRNEVEELLYNRQLHIQNLVASGLPLPAAAFTDNLEYSQQPLPLGFSDTLLLDTVEREMVPYRQLTFRLQPARAVSAPQWLTLRKSLVETEDVLAVVLGVMVGVLALLLLGVVGLNRWLAGRIWSPFQRTLAALRAYDLQRHQPLNLPTPAIEEFAALNQALNSLSERLVLDYESLRQFTENAAHETQTPLAIIQAKLEQLLQAPTLMQDEGTANLVGETLRATLRLSRLHQSLTLLTRLENHQFVPTQAVPLQLEEVLRERAAMLEPLLAARQVTLTMHTEPPLPLRTMHPGLADSLLQNLLHNAIRHNYPGGQVEVFLQAKSLAISNTGPAPTGDPARFFERFQKHNLASDSPGLGLSIAQHICRYYGFKIQYAFTEVDGRHTLRVQFA
ncbi:sensor histidine kinase [Hymenobacter persicinus]|uniref:histidine kinase n=1 Tax=Hymenobacter persicinus TaxID=2025506 RepID=A0A4Q5LAV3_9BACT|nr:HAMP domain-containing sensor histidine kinase [Hymenobacter persicinus]RYU79266.1 HAMP domain-containing histidine kinase [Hymenobacter persicinus]